MLRVWFTLVIALMVVSFVRGQETKPTTKPNGPIQATANLTLAPDAFAGPEMVSDGYLVEMRILEGDGLEEKAIEETMPPSTSSDLWESMPRRQGVTTLTNMRIAVTPNKTCTIELKTEKAFSYLEALGNDKFELKHTKPLNLGLNFAVVAQRVDGDDQHVDLSVKSSVSVLDGRESVEGLGLAVGKPIITKLSLETSAKIKLGIAKLIDIPISPRTRSALLLRVSEVDAKTKRQQNRMTDQGSVRP